MTKIKVLIVDDHPLMREALRVAIENETGMDVVGEARNGNEAVAQAVALSPDVIIMDIFMPGKDGLTAIGELRALGGQKKIMALTSSTDEQTIKAALQSGALAYLNKDAQRDELLFAIRKVAQGETYLGQSLANRLAGVLYAGETAPIKKQKDDSALTPREMEIVELVGQGLTNHDIGKKLTISDGTVRTHLHHIMEKLGLANRNQLVLFATRRNERRNL